MQGTSTSITRSDMCRSMLATQLLLVLLAGCNARSAVPAPDSRVMTRGSMELDGVKKNKLVNILSGIFDWTSPEGDDVAMRSIEDPDLPYRPERSMYNTQTPRDRGLCKNFFWKTFSAC